MKLVTLEREIADDKLMANIDPPIQVTDEQKSDRDLARKHCEARIIKLEDHRGKAYSKIYGQCMPILLDKMKHHPDWANTQSDPLALIRLIEKTILSQTEDQYPFATVYDHETALCNFSQNTLTNAQWYERFCTKVDIGNAIGITRQHKVLLEYVAAELGATKFDDLSEKIQKDVRAQAEEQYLAYVFLRQSGKQHNKLKMDLQNEFTTGNDKYPRQMQSVLHLVERYTKSPIVIPTASEGSAFAQNGGKDGKGGTRRREPYSKTHWKDQYCHTCKKKGHPTKHCPNKNDRKNDDDKSRSSKSSNKSSKSKSSKVNASELKRLKKQFATFDNDLKELTPDDSDISDSSDGEEASNFQYEEPSTGFQMMQLDVVSHDIQGVPTEDTQHY
jgi:hypothetical protein